MTKRVSIMFVLLLVMQSVLSGLNLHASSADSPEDLGSIFTFESLTKNDEEIADGAVVDVADGDSVELKFSWDTEGVDVKAGDFAETDIPDAFKFARDMDGDVKLDSGEKVGTFTIIDNKLRFEFDEGKEEHGQVSNGTFTFRADFNLEKFEKDVVEEIEFKGKEDKTLTVIGKPSGEIKAINKDGIPDSEKDAKEITWTIDILNPSEEAMTDASLTDVIPEGLELDESSIVVNDLTVGLNGALTKGDEFTVASSVNGQKLDIPFDEIDPYKGYRVEYTTTITDYSKTQFTNEANLVDGDKELPAKATVDIERSDYVEKYGTELDNGNIEWTIDVNKAGGSIDEAIIEDELPKGLNLETIEILKLTQDGDNWNKSESDKTAVKFPVNLGKVTSDDTYRIKVETSIDYSKVNDGNYEQATEFTNEAILKDGDKDLDRDEDKVNVTRKPILSKKGSDVDIDHKEGKKLKWVVTVNEANHKIDNAVITDTLPAGLTIDKADIVVKDSKGDVVTSNANITVPTNDGSAATEIEIDLGNITEKHTITYFTKVTDFSKNDFKNEASLGGSGIGPDNPTDNDTTEPKGNYYNKKSTARDADKQTISWESEVNPYREAISGLVITDTFPKKGLFLLEDTVKIKVGSKDLTKGTDFTLSTDSTYKDGFKIEFNDSVFPIEEKMILTYDTSYNLKDVILNTGDKDKRYNEIKFTGETANENEIDVDKDADVTVGSTTVNSGKKEGNLVSIDEDGNQVNGWHSGNERKLEWEVYINYLEQDLGTDVTVEDVLGYDGEVDIDNLEVKKYTVNKKGETTLGDAIDDTKYDVLATDDGFTLNFKEAVSERYAIVFTTSVPKISEGIYKNTATTKVGDKEYPYTGSINFDKTDKNLSKKAIGIEGNEVFTDDEIDWEIKINEDLSIIQKDIKVVDTISAGMEYKNDSLEIFKLEGTDEVKVDSSAYDLDVRHKDDGKTELRVDFKDTISSTYVLKYTTIVTETDGEVNNEVNFTGKNFETTSVESEKLSAEQFSSTSGDKTRGKIQVVKVDANDEDVKLEGAGFKLHYKFNGENRYIETTDGEETHYTKSDGTIEFLGLQVNRIYYLEEVSPPEGYEILDGEVIKINDLKSLNIEPKGHVETVKNGKLIDVSGVKTWLDENSENRPESITVQVMNSTDSDPVREKEVTEGDEWNYTFTDLPKYNQEGKEIVYTVAEVDVPEGYKATRDGNDITNLRVGTTEVDIVKHWNDEDASERPDVIKVNLLQNKVQFGDPYEVTKANDWELNIAELPEFDSNGKAYEYTVSEHDVPGYAPEVDGFEITNTRADEKSIEITKTWLDDNSDERPGSIEVELVKSIADGDKKSVETYQLKATDDWSIKIDKLPAFNPNGRAYTYEIVEVAVEGYETDVKGFDITNLRVGTTEVFVEKIWSNEEYDFYQPDEISVNLLQNDEVIKTEDLTPNDVGAWKYTFTDLPEFDEDGKSYDYSIEEVEIPGYVSDVENHEDGTFTITNTQQTTEITGTKTWIDNGDATESRPNSITIQAMNGDDIVAEQEVSPNEDGEWAYTFTDLPTHDKEGNEIGYTINELPVPGYATDYDGNNIINTRAELLDIEGKKSWSEIDKNQRPESIVVQLIANGKTIDEKVVIDETNWQYKFEQFPGYDEEGKAIVYEVNEVPMPGYITEINGFDLSNTQLTKNITGIKTWKNDTETDRPDSITVHLLANGDKIDNIKVTADMDWKYVFTNVPAYDKAGEPIEYSIEEDLVDQYSTTINGFDITNTYNPDETAEAEKGDSQTVPKTATPYYNFMLIGIMLMAFGILFMVWQRTRRTKKKYE